MHADSGEVIVNHKIIGKDIDFPENMGALIENPGFLWYETGFDNLNYLARINGKISKEEVKKAIELVGLSPDSRKKTGKYSLGMKQRLGIAQAIMENPDILILDEPMNGLDDTGVQDIRKLLLNFKGEGKIVLIASHNKEDIEVLCDQVYRVSHGKIEIQSSDQNKEDM
jgi:ABC-2 type transport system ATP-binding protein